MGTGNYSISFTPSPLSLSVTSSLSASPSLFLPPLSLSFPLYPPLLLSLSFNLSSSQTWLMYNHLHLSVSDTWWN